MLLLDQGLPRSTVHSLRPSRIEAQHTGDLGLSAADDATILRHARAQNMIVVTLDADFHALLALSGAARPSVIRIRIEGLKGDELARLLVRIVDKCGEDLARGALVTVTETSLRVHLLPITR